MASLLADHGQGITQLECCTRAIEKRLLNLIVACSPPPLPPPALLPLLPIITGHFTYGIQSAIMCLVIKLVAV